MLKKNNGFTHTASVRNVICPLSSRQVKYLKPGANEWPHRYQCNALLLTWIVPCSVPSVSFEILGLCTEILCRRYTEFGITATEDAITVGRNGSG